MDETETTVTASELAGEEPRPDVVKLAYIEGDTVMEGRFPGTDLLPAVEFTYHPVNAMEDHDYWNKIAGAAGKRKEAYRAMLNFISKHLKTWDLKKAVQTDGKTTLVVVDHTDIKELLHVAPAVLDYIQGAIQSSTEDVRALEKKSGTLFGSV